MMQVMSLTGLDAREAISEERDSQKYGLQGVRFHRTKPVSRTAQWWRSSAFRPDLDSNLWWIAK
jgi:hypothetical protein